MSMDIWQNQGNPWPSCSKPHALNPNGTQTSVDGEYLNNLENFDLMAWNMCKPQSA